MKISEMIKAVESGNLDEKELCDLLRKIGSYKSKKKHEVYLVNSDYQTLKHDALIDLGRMDEMVRELKNSLAFSEYQETGLEAILHLWLHENKPLASVSAIEVAAKIVMGEAA